MICFDTEVALPLDEPQMVEMITPQTVFDRETGEGISGWDLFTIPEAEVRAWVSEHAAGDDPVLRREMEAALEPEWIHLLSGGLSVDFPQGTLPSQETAYGWYEAYEKVPVLRPGPSRTSRRSGVNGLRNLRKYRKFQEKSGKILDKSASSCILAVRNAMMKPAS